MDVSNTQKGVVYLITNRVNQKQYVGQTTRKLQQRWNDHIAASKDESNDFALYRAIRKYGVESFTIEPLVECDSADELNYAEQYFIEALGTLKEGYNMTSGGDNGYRFSTEVKEKMSAHAQVLHRTIEYRQKMRDANIGQKRSDEAKENMSRAALKRMEDPKEREKAGNGRRGSVRSACERKKTSESLQKTFGERITCPLCGKTMSPPRLGQHLRYYCPGNSTL